MPRVTRPATKARRARELEVRRAALLKAAEAVFREKGYISATTDEVAEQAGVAVGTIYNVLGTKDQLYGEVVAAIAEELVALARRLVVEAPDGMKTVEDLVVARISGFQRQRLFFALFSCERASGAYPALAVLPRRVKDLHRQYLELVATLLERGTAHGRIAGVEPLDLAISLEGVLNAFMGYWSGPPRSMPPEALARHVIHAFLGLRTTPTGGESQPGLHSPTACAPEAPREVYISRFDLIRLTELIAVARAFGGPTAPLHLDALERELSRGRVVDPRAVPPDVVTMNSQVTLKNLSTGRRQVRRLVFPADMGKDEESLTIFDPLGTAILGCRVSSVVEVHDGRRLPRYRIEALLYQPESAGDYHL